MHRIRAFAVVVLLGSVAVSTLAHAGGSSRRTLSAPYQGAYEYTFGSGGVGMGCAEDNCLRFQVGRFEHRVRVVVRDAHCSAVPFVMWDATPGDVDRTATRHGCGRQSFRVSVGHVYEVVPQDGVRDTGCAGLATTGVISATLRR
jgi:hypothetical protein